MATRRVQAVRRKAHRLFTCAQCGCLTQICTSCDRGQRYCGPTCRRQARKQQQHEAGYHYQRSERGRQQHAARQRAYYARQAEAQRSRCSADAPSASSSDPQSSSSLLPTGLAEVVEQKPTQGNRSKRSRRPKCLVCGKCSSWLRRRFLECRRPGSETRQQGRALSTPP